MSSHSHSGQYWFLELSISTQAHSFAQLEQRMDAFQPLSQEAINDEWQKMWNYFRPMNPTVPEESLKRFIDSQITLGRSERMQYFTTFIEPFAVQTIAITLLSHALVEAIINAALALGLYHVGKPQMFGMLEKANVKHKWTVGPQCFLPAYALPKSNAMYEGLSILCRRRNSYVHSKIALNNENNQVVLPGSPDSGFSIDSEARKLLHRFLSLPYELHQHLLNQIPDQLVRFTLEQILRSKRARE
jgi:hypothetical protein